MDKRLLDILCCPTTRLPLRLLDAGELTALNRAIGEGAVADAGGTRIGEPLGAGLITRDGRTIYRVEDDIPVMLADQAIAAAGVAGFSEP